MPKPAIKFIIIVLFYRHQAIKDLFLGRVGLLFYICLARPTSQSYAK